MLSLGEHTTFGANRWLRRLKTVLSRVQIPPASSQALPGQKPQVACEATAKFAARKQARSRELLVSQAEPARAGKNGAHALPRNAMTKKRMLEKKDAVIDTVASVEPLTPTVVSAELLENRVLCARRYEELRDRYYGKELEGRLELGFVEALYLVSKGRLAVKKGAKKMAFKELLAFALERDKRMSEKLAVYSDLPNRGLVVKTGFKFG